jgi:hypothetical protein
MNSKYRLVLMPKSHCPECNTLVYWLHEPEAVNYAPSFFICYNCRYVGQTGVGPVINDSEPVEPK